MARILVFRIGSIGDFVISLPCLHLICKKYWNDEIVLLANEPLAEQEIPADSILQGSGLVDKFINYPANIRNLSNLRALRTAIQQCAPELLLYLAPPRGHRVKSARRTFFSDWRVVSGTLSDCRSTR